MLLPTCLIISFHEALNCWIGRKQILESIVELNIAEFVCLQQLALVLRRCCDPRSQKSPDTQLDGFQFLQAIAKRQRGKLTSGRFEVLEQRS
jgi:hypothetical protein